MAKAYSANVRPGEAGTEVSSTTHKSHRRSYDAALAKRGYVIVGSLGEGSYAKVKKAHSSRQGGHVALKIIDQSIAPQDFVEKFMPREFDIHRKVNHPCIIQLYDLFRIGHRIYMAMELAGHGDLLDYVRLRGAIPEPQSRFMFRQLVDAVRYLHTLGVIHRDLKCENILLDLYNNIKITDFGFARWMRPGVDRSKTYCGSAAYAAPEILRGVPYTGYGYDMWSLGVVLFILVCGSMPYDDTDLSKMVKIQLEHRLHFPSRIVDDLNPDVKLLIRSLLHPDVKKRATSSEVLASPWLKQQRFFLRNAHNVSSETVSNQSFETGKEAAAGKAPTSHRAKTVQKKDSKLTHNFRRKSNDGWRTPEGLPAGFMASSSKKLMPRVDSRVSDTALQSQNTPKCITEERARDFQASTSDVTLTSSRSRRIKAY